MRRRRSVADIDRTRVGGEQIEHRLRHRQFAAMNPRFNKITIDGVSASDTFGLEGNNMCCQ